MNMKRPRLHRTKVLGLLVAVFCIALAPRLLYVLQIQTEPFSDEADYVECAANLLLGEGLIMSEQYKAYRAPGYPLFLASILAWSGDFAIVTIRSVQAVLGACLCALVALLAVRLMESLAAGAIAGLVAAFFDELIFYTGQLLSETLYALLLVAWLSCFLQFRRQNRQVVWYLFGVGVGILALVRPPGVVFVLIPLLYAFALPWPSRDPHVPDPPGAVTLARKRLLALLVIAGVITAVLPWSVRNVIVLGKFVPFTTNTGVNLYIGHNPYFGYWSTGNKTGIREQTDLNEVEESALFTRLALEYISDDPAGAFERAGLKLWYLFLYPWPEAQWYQPYGEEGPTVYGPMKPWPWFGEGRDLRFSGGLPLPTIPWSVIIPTIYLAWLGLRLSLRDWRRWMPFYLVIVLHTLPYLVFFGRARFRNPLLPVFILFMVFAVMEVGRVYGKWREGSGKRGVKATATADPAAPPS